MIDRLHGYLGLAIRGGYVLYGEEVLKRISHCGLVFLANDASLATETKVERIVQAHQVSYTRCFDKATIAKICGKGEVALLGITHRGLAKQMQTIIKEGE